MLDRWWLHLRCRLLMLWRRLLVMLVLLVLRLLRRLGAHTPHLLAHGRRHALSRVSEA